MYQTKKSRGAGLVLILLSVLTVHFIFSRSLHNAQTSALESGSIVNFLGAFFAKIGMTQDQADFFVRKMAHFFEFFIMGIFLTLAVRKNSRRTLAKNLFFVLFLLLAVPICDESLQYVSPGRSPEVKDVLLDFAGAFCGFLLVFLIDRLHFHFNGKKRGK